MQYLIYIIASLIKNLKHFRWEVGLDDFQSSLKTNILPNQMTLQ